MDDGCSSALMPLLRATAKARSPRPAGGPLPWLLIVVDITTMQHPQWYRRRHHQSRRQRRGASSSGHQAPPRDLLVMMMTSEVSPALSTLLSTLLVLMAVANVAVGDGDDYAADRVEMAPINGSLFIKLPWGPTPEW